MTKAFVFDLDGTILDTLFDIGNACNLALQARGYPIHPLEAYQQMVGNGFYVLVQRALQGVSISENDFASLLDLARHAYTEHMCERTKPYPGLHAALRSLAQKGYPLMVLSNKPEPMTQHLVRHYFPDIPFAFVAGGREDFLLKPDPTRLLAMLAAQSCEPKDSYFIGDSNVDMQTAIAAGMIPIGCAWGFRGARELLKFGASKLLETPSEIAALG